MLVYNIVSISMAVLVVIGIFIVGAFGTTDLNTCFIKSGSKGQLSEFIPLLINFPLILILLLYSIIRSENIYEPVLINMIMVSATIGITLGLATIFSLLGAAKILQPNTVDSGVMVGALSGFSVGISRLLNKKLWIEIGLKFKKTFRLKSYSLGGDFERSGSLGDDLNFKVPPPNLLDLHDMFSKVTIRVIAI